MSRIAGNMQDVHARIAAAAAKVSRDPQEIRLLAVSKTFDARAVMEAVDAGQHDFGENYLQEALDKIEEVRRMQNSGDAPATMLKWHFIGPVQSNKTRPLAENFDWVHAIDREKIAARLSEQRPAHLPPLDVCIQVNISGEASKSGVTPDALPALAHAIAAMPRLRLRGLMAIPEVAAEFDGQRVPFRALRQLYEELRAGGLPLDTLSIGMSADLEAAIAEGATIVRIGSAIFGQRTYGQSHAIA
jgi:pyridoxal phosphate enzyme (YggS family)